MKKIAFILLYLLSTTAYTASIKFHGQQLSENNSESFMDYIMSKNNGDTLYNVCFESDLNKEIPEDVIDALNDFVTEGMTFQYVADDEGGTSIGFDLYDEQNEWEVVIDLGINICK